MPELCFISGSTFRFNSTYLWSLRVCAIFVQILSDLFLVRPEADLCSTADVFCYFFTTKSLSFTGWSARNFAPWSVLGWILKIGSKHLEARTKKKLGAKNMQNLAWFWATSNFDGECLQNGWRYSKRDK